MPERKASRTKDTSDLLACWTNTDIIQLMYFSVLTRMCVHPVNKDTIVSLVHGYELGRGNKLDLTLHIRQLMTKKYKIEYSSDGWPGQIERYAKKKSMSWVIAFRQIIIGLIWQQGQEPGLKKFGRKLKSRIGSLIDQIETPYRSSVNASWIEEWTSICMIENKRFSELWSRQEWTIIKAIDAAVQQGEAAGDFIELKHRYTSLPGYRAPLGPKVVRGKE